MHSHSIPRLVIVSPCYNEEAILVYSAGELTALLERLIAAGKILSTSHVLYVNDGSSDRTWELIEELESLHRWTVLSRQCGASVSDYGGYDDSSGCS